jgi:RNA polymerase sigma-70 factor, ECF subfamily
MSADSGPPLEVDLRERQQLLEWSGRERESERSAAMTSTVEDEMAREVAENAISFDPGTEDAALVAAAKNGDAQAFEGLVERHQSRIRAIASRFTRIPEDAEDIAQQSFQKAFIHLRQFEGNSAFSTWLTRIAINEALMWLRRKRASREVSIAEPTTENGTTLPLDSPDPSPSPEDSYLQREWKEILFRAMNELTPAMRTAIKLRHISELSAGETAGVMGVSAAAVKARIFHGRRKLRGMLKHYVKSSRSRGSKALATNEEAKGAPAPSACACD